MSPFVPLCPSGYKFFEKELPQRHQDTKNCDGYYSLQLDKLCYRTITITPNLHNIKTGF